MEDCIIHLDNCYWFDNSKNSLPISKSQSHIEPQMMCTHGKTIEYNDDKFFEVLYKWYNKINEKLFLPKLYLDKTLVRLHFLKHNPKKQTTRDDFEKKPRYVCYILN